MELFVNDDIKVPFFSFAPHTNVLLPPCLFIRLIAKYYVVLIFVQLKCSSLLFQTHFRIRLHQ